MTMRNILNPKLWTSRYFWTEFKYGISSFFNPRQKWLTSKIPKTYSDKVELLRIVCFECIVNFVEKEKCFEHINWESDEGHSIAASEIQKSYDMVKVEIPELEKLLEGSYKNSKVNILNMLEKDEGSNYYNIRKFLPEEQKEFNERLELSNKIETLTQEACMLIMKNRNYLWT